MSNDGEAELPDQQSASHLEPELLVPHHHRASGGKETLNDVDGTRENYDFCEPAVGNSIALRARH